MTKEVTGYKFNNINGFNASSALCNTHFGIPYNDEAVTRNYIAPSISYKEDLVTVDFYYVVGDIAPVLGFPTEFEIRLPNEEI
jgi:hypothetical protein